MLTKEEYMQEWDNEGARQREWAAKHPKGREAMERYYAPPKQEREIERDRPRSRGIER